MFRQIRLAAAAFLVSAAPASAGTIYDFDATTLIPNIVSSFSLRFDDTSGDGLLQLGEIIPNTFSGITLLGFSFNILSCVPNTSVSTGICTGNAWGFARTGDSATGLAGTESFTYALTPVSAVPLPPALLLLGSALGLTGLLRWWRARRTPALPVSA